MENLNIVQLRGYVGNARTQQLGETECCRFSVATNYAYTDRDGTKLVDTTWHNCVAWLGGSVKTLEGIEKGAGVELTGRLRYVRYTGVDGIERTSPEIVVNDIMILVPAKKAEQ